MSKKDYILRETCVFYDCEGLHEVEETVSDRPITINEDYDIPYFDSADEAMAFARELVKGMGYRYYKDKHILVSPKEPGSLYHASTGYDANGYYRTTIYVV